LVLPGGEPLYRAIETAICAIARSIHDARVADERILLVLHFGCRWRRHTWDFLVAFYLIANKFGAWAPQELNYEDSVSTAIPWIGGIAIGLLASTSEEFFFVFSQFPSCRN